jgi:hypothetical protein
VGVNRIRYRRLHIVSSVSGAIHCKYKTVALRIKHHFLKAKLLNFLQVSTTPEIESHRGNY